jgi:hypothetical protein
MVFDDGLHGQFGAVYGYWISHHLKKEKLLMGRNFTANNLCISSPILKLNLLLVANVKLLTVWSKERNDSLLAVK